MPDETAEREPPQPFDRWLAGHRHGEATLEWADELAALLLACQETGKKGSLTITIEVDPSGRTVTVTDKLKTKLPEYAREVGVYWVDDSGSLVRDDPRQMRLPIQNQHDGGPALVDPETGEIRRRDTQ